MDTLPSEKLDSTWAPVTDAQASPARRCRACSGLRTSEFFRAEGVPVVYHASYNSRADARAAPRGVISLHLCRDCGYIYNAAFDPALAAYGPGYDNALQFSPRFHRYARKLARRIIRRIHLRDKRIVEVGCGDGHFLTLLCEMGPNSGIGFDPAYSGNEAPELAAGNVSFRRERYGQAHADLPVDFIFCRHVLEHVGDPVGFLAELRKTIGDRHHVRLYFEMPDALHLLQGAAVWDILYEHCSYFLAEALRRVLRRTGLEPFSTWQAYEGQFLATFARPLTSPPSQPLTPALARPVQSLADEFTGRFGRKLARWQDYLAKQQRDGKRTVFWGAGSKAVTLLNALQDSDVLVPYVVDVNLRKHGKFIAGTAQQVVAPGFLQKYRPDAVVIMNPIYKKEIARMLGALDVRCELVVA